MEFALKKVEGIMVILRNDGSEGKSFGILKKKLVL
jgi:hypothetical protein